MSTENGAWQKCDKQPNQGENSSICNFQPDYDLSTPRAQQWKADSDVQRTRPLDLNENGEYKVKWGDSLSTIAERALKGAGQSVNRDSLQSMQEAIVQANHERYPTLDCNKDFVKENWCLKIPGCSQQERQPPVVERPPQPPIEERPLPPVEQPRHRVCPDRDRERPMPDQDYRRYPQPEMQYPRYPGIINEPGGVINIFLGGMRPHFERPNLDRNYYQWSNRDYDMPREQYRPMPRIENNYRPEYDYRPWGQEMPRHCSPCEMRQMYHNMRMPQVLRRNPVYSGW